MDDLTDRQKRELEYHKGHSAVLSQARETVNFEVITSPNRRWWNAYWSIWGFLRGIQLQGKSVLVVGCGSGVDALLFAKLGAVVSAFDLSPDMLAHGIRHATENGLSISFEQMPAERMSYPRDTFDLVFARDILHHVDIPPTMNEVVRVAKPGALFVLDEIYSHSITNAIRHSWVVERMLYPRMTGFIYKGRKPYITEDERKMSESDVAQVRAKLSKIQSKKYFNFIVTRLLPDKFKTLNKLDRFALMVLGPLGYYIAGRLVLVGTVRKV